jgi:acetyl esterase/lipase
VAKKGNKMKRMIGGLFFAVQLALFAQAAPPVISLWPNGAPGFESRKDIPEQAASYWVKNINNPSLTVFLPPKEKVNGAAVVICPGGGFRELVFGAEGVDPAKYFNDLGVTAFVLKYRLFRETNSVFTIEHPHEDGLRAMRLVRSRAGEWGIDTNRLGMVGFSAGGEVVSLTAFGETAGHTNAPDAIDQANARPDFIVEIYPGGAGIPQTLPSNAPPAFLLVADDDNHTDSVLKLFNLYRAAKIPVEVHVFTKGAHGFNLGQRSKLATIKNWPQRLTDWMGDNNILDPTVPARGVK